MTKTAMPSLKFQSDCMPTFSGTHAISATNSRLDCDPLSSGVQTAKLQLMQSGFVCRSFCWFIQL